MSLTNPFFSQSVLPYQAPRFDLIEDRHYRPAFDEGMRQKRAEIDAIVQNPQAPDFENTYLALEQSGALLTRVTSVFFAMTAAHTNDELQRLDEAFSAELAALANDIYLNSTLFARVDAVWRQRETLALDAESLRLVEIIHQRFVLSGAQLGDDDKAQLRSLNTESATLTSQFNQRLLAANKSGGMVVDYRHQLDGLSQEEVALAADAAREKGLADRWLIPLLNTTQQPTLAVLRDRQTRENLFNAAWTRAEKNDANDTRAIVQRLVDIRTRQATLLGFASYAAWKTADQMAKTPDAALAFMRAIVPAARQRALDEQAEIQKVIDDEQGGFTTQAWDWAYYAEQVRRGKYALDEAQLKPYFALDTVLNDGCSGRQTSCSALSLSSALISRFTILMCASGKFSIMMASVWRCFMVISLPANQKAAAHGWVILLNNPRLTKPDRLSTTSVITRSQRQGSPHCCFGMM
ncbi:dipeptidyl carboxypeptidase II [Citrobacter koseri]|uniref:Dipeptidyl carboxypeptidase II n=1 Tax=Citrobacter koseri TaxID=545 RepID=A0A3S4M402_CITKO|nr:dipeptidyl carboxypeptidase II [Citrobacter koseri]